MRNIFTRNKESPMARLELGDNAKDVVTGFEGVIDSVHFYLNGCVRYGITPTKLQKDGEPGKTQIVDANQCVGTGKNIRAKLAQSDTIAVQPGPSRATGGPRNDPPRRELPARR